MDKWQDWFFSKKTLEWMFSGVGIFVPAALRRWLLRKKRSQQAEAVSTSNQTSITTSRSSMAIAGDVIAQSGGTVNMTTNISEQQIEGPHRLGFKIEEINMPPKARIGGPAGTFPALYARICVINRGQRDCSIISLLINEEDGTAWELTEPPFSPKNDQPSPPINLPMCVLKDSAQVFGIRAKSSIVYDELPSQVWRIKLKIKDHLDELHEIWLTDSPIEQT